MNPQYVQYAPQDAVNVNVNGHFQPNAFAPGTYQQPLPYPAVPAGQHQQPYYSPVPAAQPQQESPQSALHASVQSHQYAQPPVASPSPGQNGPGAPPPDPQSPSLSQYADLSNNVRRDAEEDEDDGDALQPDGHDGNEPVFHLPPPPEATYPNEAALEEAVHSWSLEHGYELVRRASKKNARGVLYKRYMHCSKHGKAANTGKLTDQTRIRHNRKSQRMNCPMSLAVVAVDPNNPEGEWQVRHRKTHHNHGPLEALNLVGHRRRARAGGIEQAVDGLFAIGTPTAQVLQFLERTNPHGLFTRTDVANMKLKYKKFGTCLIKGDTASSHGRPCNYCRAKKTKCDNSRPSCSLCSQNGINCEYDRPQEDEQPSVPGVDGATETEMMQVDEDPLSLDPQGQQSAQRNRNRGTVSQFQQNAQRAEEILANLQAFQTQHVAPVKLDLQSSAVEILAASSCGSGESYKIVPLLQSASDWPAYRDLMTEACMKENTFEVLVGTKTEPSPPPLDCKVEDWNEYIKKLAIFNRRNTALSGVLWGTLAPTFRNRVQHIKNAAEIWSVLEDVCLPQGSDTGFRLYMELHDISHANSADLKDYIVRLENAYMAFNRLSHHWRSQHGNASSSNTNNQSGAAAAAAPMPFSTLNSSHPSSKLPPAQPIFSEEMLCFLFLRNLAPEFARWAEGVCATNNVAGFGTGPKLGFVDLTRRAVEHEIALRCRR